MAAIQQDAIVAAIVAALKTAPALAGSHVDDEPSFNEWPETVSSAIRVHLIDSQPIVVRYGRVDWRTVVRVSCAARDDRPTVDGRPSGQLGGQVFARLMTAQTLGGVADRIEPPILNYDLTFVSTRIGVLNMDFPVRHSTAAGTLF